MSVTKEDIKKIAHLSRIGINDAQIEQLDHDLNHILEMASKMNNVDTASVEPLAHPMDTTQPQRKDVVTETNQRELFQSIAPQVHSGLYIVPKVIE